MRDPDGDVEEDSVASVIGHPYWGAPKRAPLTIRYARLPAFEGAPVGRYRPLISDTARRRAVGADAKTTGGA